MIGNCLCIGCENQVEMIDLRGVWKAQPCAECCRASLAEKERNELAARNDELTRAWKQRCPVLFQRTDLCHPDLDQKIMSVVLRWRPETTGQGFGLRSKESGTGKTRMMWALLREVHFAGIRWRAISACELARLYGTTQAERAAAEADVERLCLVPVLFLDDLGKERADHDAIPERLFHLLNRRYEAGVPLLWTSNFTSQVLMNRLGERGEKIVRRLKEMAPAYDVVKGRGVKNKQVQERRAAA